MYGDLQQLNLGPGLPRVVGSDRGPETTCRRIGHTHSGLKSRREPLFGRRHVFAMCVGTFPLFMCSRSRRGLAASSRGCNSIHLICRIGLCRIGLLTRSPVRPSVGALLPPFHRVSRHVSELGPWWHPWSARTCV